MNFVGVNDPLTILSPSLAHLTPDVVGQDQDVLISSLLGEQRDLTAVERFSQFHEAVAEPSQERYYSALLPATPPGPGQQLAFEVDLDRCSGCKACVVACHSLNGLDEGESWREVGLLLGGPTDLPVLKHLPTALPLLQHVTTSCHHCLDPACLSACPVNAYEKDPVSGIVKHLDDQCIGCQYCTLACPYDAPKFHQEKGIVRKCDMCSDRLKVGEAPACVQACPHEAIRIRVVDVQEVEAKAKAGEFLPTAFDPNYTKPTTVYHSRFPQCPGQIQAADEHRLEPEHAHGALVAMLVLTQLAVGGFLLVLLGRLAGIGKGIDISLLSWMSLGLGFAGISASLLHLGRPLYAYRAILGVRHSWLSREVLAFGVFAALAMAFVGLEGAGLAGEQVFSTIANATLWGTVLVGLAGLGCSVMVYQVVRRPFWQARFGVPRFLGTALVLGLATALASLGLSGVFASTSTLAVEPGSTLLPWVALALIGSTLVKLGMESAWLLYWERAGSEPLQRSARLLLGPLRNVFKLRWFLGMLGGVVLPLILIWAGFSGAVNSQGIALATTLALVASIGGELAERYLFFTAVTRPKMPGGLSS